MCASNCNPHSPHRQTDTQIDGQLDRRTAIGKQRFMGIFIFATHFYCSTQNYDCIFGLSVLLPLLAFCFLLPLLCLPSFFLYFSFLQSIHSPCQHRMGLGLDQVFGAALKERPEDSINIMFHI